MEHLSLVIWLLGFPLCAALCRTESIKHGVVRTKEEYNRLDAWLSVIWL